MTLESESCLSPNCSVNYFSGALTPKYMKLALVLLGLGAVSLLVALIQRQSNSEWSRIKAVGLRAGACCVLLTLVAASALWLHKERGDWSWSRVQEYKNAMQNKWRSVAEAQRRNSLLEELRHKYFLSYSNLSPESFPIKASANGRYFVDRNNFPVLIVGDAPMSIVSELTPIQQNTYFDDRQAHGFNALWINLLCADYTGCAPSGKTYDNVAPFRSGRSPADYDLSTPNDAYFNKYDVAIALAASHGLVVFLNPIETGSWLITLRNNGPTKAFNYGVYVGNRYKNVPNIIWLHGNDFGDNTAPPSDIYLVAQIMAGIASVDRNHLQTLEIGNPNYKRNSDAYSNADQGTAIGPYLQADLTYSWAPTYNVNLLAYNSSPTMPVLFGEGNYEFENLTGAFPGKTGAFILRMTAYWALTSGAAGYLYGNHYVWTSTWPSTGNLDSRGAAQIPYLNTLFTSIEWWKLVPDETHSVVTAGYGTYTTGNSNLYQNTYCSTAWVTDRTVSLTYCPNHTTLTVAMDQFSGLITARWYDPSSGTYLAIAGSPFTNNGTHQFAMPRNNSDGDPDWVLVLTTSRVPG
jgi:hypothetical protein